MNSIITGDCLRELKNITEKSIDLIFADPPYFMQTNGILQRSDGSGEFKGCNDSWDKFTDYKDYKNFSTAWISLCKKTLKDNGSLFIIGSFTNIYTIGALLLEMGFWIINDIIWQKSNPVPNFAGTRLVNSSEIILWVVKDKKSKFTFNYKTMKHLNGGTQMKNIWEIPLCTGIERLKDNNGVKIHNTQKPQKLLENIILMASKKGDVVLDPFFGTGTTGAVAKKLQRKFIGIEREEKYLKYARERIAQVEILDDYLVHASLDEKIKYPNMKELIKLNKLKKGDVLYSKNREAQVSILENGWVKDEEEELSIHKMSAKYLNKENNNGWDYWFVKRNDKLTSINEIRKEK